MGIPLLVQWGPWLRASRNAIPGNTLLLPRGSCAVAHACVSIWALSGLLEIWAHGWRYCANTNIIKRAFSPQPARETSESTRNLFHSHHGTDRFMTQSLNFSSFWFREQIYSVHGTDPFAIQNALFLNLCSENRFILFTEPIRLLHRTQNSWIYISGTDWLVPRNRLIYYTERPIIKFISQEPVWLFPRNRLFKMTAPHFGRVLAVTPRAFYKTN